MGAAVGSVLSLGLGQGEGIQTMSCFIGTRGVHVGCILGVYDADIDRVARVVGIEMDEASLSA